MIDNIRSIYARSCSQYMPLCEIVFKRWNFHRDSSLSLDQSIFRIVYVHRTRFLSSNSCRVYKISNVKHF